MFVKTITMYKNVTLIALLVICNFFYAQDRAKDSLQALIEFKKLSSDFISAKSKFDAEKSKFNSLKDRITPNNPASLADSLKIRSSLYVSAKKEVDSIIGLADSFKNIYVSKGLKQKFLDSLFTHKKDDASKLVVDDQQRSTDKIFFYYGRNVIEEKNDLFKDKVANQIIQDALSADSKTYLGDFRIPRKDQKIDLYEENPITKYDKLLKVYPSAYIKSTKNKYLLLQKVRIHILEGSLYDIQIYLSDLNGNVYFFENRRPISLLRYPSVASRNFIPFKMANPSMRSQSIDTSEIQDLYIRLADVLMYVPNPGDNYVPEDLTLTFPDLQNEKIHQDHSVVYKVQQDTALQNIVELRTYTDFLGLFADAPNGLVQLEGKADFYINPFNYKSVYFGKKITPFVNFSRLDEDVRYLDTSVSAVIGSVNINNALQILEKSYLEMGLRLTIFSYKPTKETPFTLNFYVPARYQIADLKNGNNEIRNLKVFGLGGGVFVDFKRFNNFGFTCSSEFTKFNAASFNTDGSILTPDNFWVFKNEAEVYYNPAGSKQSSVFLRLKTFNNANKGNNEAFYQLQFGYRFSIGVNKLKQ